MKKKDFYCAIIILLLMNCFLLYLLANVVQYKYVIPSSFSFIEYIFGGKRFIDEYFGYNYFGEMGSINGYMGILPSIGDFNFFIFIAPVFLLIYLIYINFKYPENKEVLFQIVQKTKIITSIFLCILVFYSFCEGSRGQNQGNINLLEYPKVCYLMFIMGIIVLILNHLRYKSNDEIIENKYLNISASRIFFISLTLFLFLNYFFCTVTKSRPVEEGKGLANLFFSLNSATYIHHNPYNLPGNNGCYLPAVILGYLPLLFIFTMIIKKGEKIVMPVFRILLCVCYFALTVITMVWFKNHFLIIGVTAKNNPSLFDYVGANFYFTLAIVVILAIYSIFDLINGIKRMSL